MAIVIERKNQYVIDILDGEGNVYHQIKFDLDDINLTGRILEFYNDAQKAIDEITQMQETAKQDLLKNGITEIDDVDNLNDVQKEMMPELMKKYYDVQLEGFKKLRGILDELCGHGTCEKIFGDTNSYTLFEAFINGLVPEFEKMGIKMQTMKKQLYDKYSSANKKVLK